ncbi:hypothetical protein GF360_00630 [candidate division WWE3 bacterium]|nr:hypothetical protein [candidate division WWE3 bacterium]
MSTIIVKYKASEDFTGNLENELTDKIIEVTSTSLDKQPESIIVGYEPWLSPVPKNAPDLLLRGETSPPRRDKIRGWAEVLLREVKALVDASLRVAVKTYVIDSVWIE